MSKPTRMMQMSADTHFSSDQAQSNQAITILYIEDNLPNQKLVERVLSRHGYRLLLADDGLSGLKVAVSEMPDLILMDINLPDMDGKEVTAALKAKSEFADTPIIALTADASESNRSRALVLGCNGFITKPIDVASFPAQIAEFLAGAKEHLSADREKATFKSVVSELATDLETKVEQLEEANRKLRKLDTAKSNFIQMVSHEMRTPLTVLEGYHSILTELAKAESNEEKRLSEVAGGIQRGIGRLSAVVQEVLNVSKITASELDLFKGPTRLADCINNAVGQYAVAADGRGVTIDIGREIAQIPLFLADQRQLTLAFANLISNAIKFTPDGQTIRISTLSEPDSVVVAFADMGPGIPQEEQLEIFEPFYSMEAIANHSTSKTRFMGGGMGLGLSITAGIIEAHGGEIWVESAGRNMDKMPGSTFYVKIPLVA